MDFLQRMLRKNGKGLFLLALCLVAALLTAGCGGASGGSPQGAKKKVTVTTSFLADMTKELAGDYVDIDLIIPAGEDPHLYVAQPADLKKLKDADLVLYHGLHFEGKMVEILEKRGTAVTADFPADAVLRMEEDGESVVDPHFWFSIALYKKATEKAAESLVKLVPEHEKEIRANTAAYLAKLDALDAEVRLYDYLLKTEEAEEAADFLASLNPHSLEVIEGAKVEPSLARTAEGTHYQFLRTGYFVVDKDTRPDKLVFNRIVGLKDSWGKVKG